MNRILSSTAALSLFAGAALAADLPKKAPPPFIPPAPPPAALSWTGFYAGLNAGATFGGSGGARLNSLPIFSDTAISGGFPGVAAATSLPSGAGGGGKTGFIGGGQLGYNYQFNSAFVGGVEADFQGTVGAGVNRSFVGVAGDPGATGAMFATQGQIHKSLDWLGTVRGRAGYLVAPSLLAYATGGLAYGAPCLAATTLTSDLTGYFGPGVGSMSFSGVRSGWTAGGGLEWMFSPHWSAKAEYAHYDLGSASTKQGLVAGPDAVNAVSPGWATSQKAAGRFDGNVVRGGVNYNFSFGAPPVVGRY